MQRRRTNRSLFLAAEVRFGRIWYCWLDRLTGEAFCGVVRGIEQPDVLDAVVWDGAPGHPGLPGVGRIGVPLIALPPLVPELNPAERLFEAIRAAIEGEVSTDLAASCARVAVILAHRDAHPEQVRSLVGWHWVLDPFEQ